jgi:hypothetical protein
VQPVEAETGNPEKTNPLRVIWASPGPHERFCVGETINLHYKFQLWFGTEFTWLVPESIGLVKISAKNKKGNIDFPEQEFPPITQGETYSGNFYYTATKDGEETIEVVVTSGKFKNTVKKSFKIQKNCPLLIRFNEKTNMSYGIVSMITTYSGSGQLYVNEDGQISGSGNQTMWSDILPYSADGISCAHNSPWEGSSGITFSGQVGKDGNLRVTMELDELSLKATSLICTGGGHSESMPFPGYTYSACEVVLTGFNFEGATLEVPFNCPGQAPFTMPITIIPRRDS